MHPDIQTKLVLLARTAREVLDLVEAHRIVVHPHAQKALNALDTALQGKLVMVSDMRNLLSEEARHELRGMSALKGVDCFAELAKRLENAKDLLACDPSLLPQLRSIERAAASGKLWGEAVQSPSRTTYLER